MSSERDWTVAEQMVVAMAAEIGDGELLTQGIGTHLPTCAYFLAMRTHAPSTRILYSTGGTFSARTGTIGLATIPRLALERPLRRASYAEIVCDTLPGMAFKEFARPAQVDVFGNTNNVLIGDPASPKLKLPGAGGIPDFSPYSSHHSYLYVPRHDRRALVERLDFRSGVGLMQGESPAERHAAGVSGKGTRLLVTNLAVIGFGAEGARLVSVHEGTSTAEVLDATGFRLAVPAVVPRTPPPTAEQLDAIREIDPHSMRDLEFVSARERLAAVKRIWAEERSGSAAG